MTKISTWLFALTVAITVTTLIVIEMPLFTVYLVGGAVFMALAVAHPRMALLLWLLAAPLNEVYGTIHLPGPDITFDRVAIIIVTTALLLRVILKGRRLIAFGAEEVAMIALLAIMVLDLLMRSTNLTSDALQEFDLFVTPVLIFLTVRNLFAGRDALKLVAYVLLLVGCYLAAYGGYQYFKASKPPDPKAPTVELAKSEAGMRTNESHLGAGRSVGPFTNAVEYGSVAAIIFLLAFILILHGGRGPEILVPLLAAAPVGVAVVLCQTRSVWLGALVGLCVLALLDRARRAIIVLTIVAISVGAVAGSMLTAGDSEIKERTSSLEPIYARLIMYQLAARLVVRQPLIGYGRGAPSRVAARKELYKLGGSEEADFAPGQFHNIFVMLLVEWGIGGVTAYAAIFLLFTKAAFELWRRTAADDSLTHHYAAFFLAATALTIVQGMLVDLPPFLYLNGLYFLLAGLLYARLDAVVAGVDERLISFPIQGQRPPRLVEATAHSSFSR